MLYINLQAAGGSLMSQLPFMALMFGIIYFFFLRPNAKARKEQDAFNATLEKGKEVVTSSGVIGKITKLDDREATIQTSEKTFIRVTRGSISNELTKAFNKVEESK